MKTLDSLIRKASSSTRIPIVAVAAAADRWVLEAVSKAITEEMASFILFDDEEANTCIVKKRLPSSIGN